MSKPKKDEVILIQTTRREALRYGLLVCTCGHPVNNHFDHGSCPCARCDCKVYTEKGRTGLQLTTGIEPQWVVNDLAELGVKVGETFYFLYKGDNIVYHDPKHEPGGRFSTPTMMYRPVLKREFGECCHPINDANPHLKGEVSVNDGHKWLPLPPSPKPKEED